MGRTMGSTDVEVAKRVETVMGHLAAGISRTAILEWSQSAECPWRDGDEHVSIRTVDRYIRKASTEFQNLAKPRKEYLLGRALYRINSIYQRSIAAGEDKLALEAQKEENKLAGLYPALKTEVTGKDGGPIEVSDVRERLAARIAALAAAGAADGAPEQPE